MDPEFDDRTDRGISGSFGGYSSSPIDEFGDQDSEFKPLALEITRVLLEESPRLGVSTQVRHLAELRVRAGLKRSERRVKFGWVKRFAPRVLQVAALAAVLVFIANGISVASASSLPGSPLYPVKRWTEQSEVIFAPTAGGRARIWMDLAGRRLDEVQRLLSIQPRVDTESLDDIDESILQALTETAGTRGQERLDLLEQLIKLAFREQTVLDELAPKASTNDRARFQQTSRLMSDVANIASSAQLNLGVPIVVPAATRTETPSSTPTATPTSTGTPTLLPTGTPDSPTPVSPTMNPSKQPDDNVSPAVETQGTGGQQPSHQGEGPVSQPTQAPENKKTSTPQGGGEEDPGPSKSVTPERHKTEYPTPPKEGTSDGQAQPATKPQDSTASGHVDRTSGFDQSTGALNATENGNHRRPGLIRSSPTHEILKSRYSELGKTLGPVRSTPQLSKRSRASKQYRG